MRRKERRQKTKRKIKIKTLIHYYTCIGEHIETHSSFTYPATGYAPYMELDMLRIRRNVHRRVFIFPVPPRIGSPSPFRRIFAKILRRDGRTRNIYLSIDAEATSVPRGFGDDIRSGAAPPLLCQTRDKFNLTINYHSQRTESKHKIWKFFFFVPIFLLDYRQILLRHFRCNLTTFGAF